MSVVYEWDVELLADGESADYEDEEVIDHYHCESFREAARYSKTPTETGFKREIVLVKDNDEGRGWAYLVNDKLMEHFYDAEGCKFGRVPQRFIKEVARA